MLDSEDVQNIKGGVEKLVTYQDDEERRKIESWLSPLNPVAQQNDFFARHQDGTGLWILESPQYNAWINGQTRENRTLFCPGIPGAGKTIISSIVVNDVYSRFPPSTNVGVAFLYCNYKTGTRHFAVDLLSSILVQLAHREPSLPDHVRQLYNNHREKPPSIQKIMSALETSVMGLSRLYLIVDALDECADDDRARSQLLAEVFRLQDLTNVSLLATSRPHIQDILDAFDGSPWLEISAQDGDIRAYIAGHMEKLPKSLRKKTGLQEAITTAIISAAKGMFLLAQLHFDSLADKTSLRDVSDALKQLPTGSDALDLAYKGAIERIEGQKPGFKTLAKRVLLWVVHAARHLTVPELQHALAIDCDDTKLDNERIVEVEDIVSVCAGLITVDKELNVLRLVHFTTQKYFEQIGNTWFPKDSHTDIAVASLLYLSYDDFDIMEVLDSQTIYWDYDNFVTDSGSSMEEDRANETEQEKVRMLHCFFVGV
jgi:hypothetical protein